MTAILNRAACQLSWADEYGRTHYEVIFYDQIAAIDYQTKEGENSSVAIFRCNVQGSISLHGKSADKFVSLFREAIGGTDEAN